MMRKTRKQNLKQFKTMKMKKIYLQFITYVEILIDSIFSYHQANIYLFIYSPIAGDAVKAQGYIYPIPGKAGLSGY